VNLFLFLPFCNAGKRALAVASAAVDIGNIANSCSPFRNFPNPSSTSFPTFPGMTPSILVGTKRDRKKAKGTRNHRSVLAGMTKRPETEASGRFLVLIVGAIV
jgi:hypothetical protein